MTTFAVHERQSRVRSEPDSITDVDAAYLRSTEVPAQATDTPMIAIVDLFAGCGGLTLGALEGARRSRRPARLVLAVDDDPVPLTVLEKTLGDADARYSTSDLGDVLAPLGKRIRASERALFHGIPSGSLLLAGPPCQGHSPLNNHTRHDDPRNDLYLGVARAARLLEPRAIVVENVSSVSSDRRSAMSMCAAALEKLGYAVTSRRVDLHRIGVPQTRVRHVLVATVGTCLAWDLQQIPGRDVRWAIDDLLEQEGERAFDMASIPKPVNRERIGWLFAQQAFDLPNHMRPDCHSNGHSYPSMYGRLRWDAPAQTVTSGFGSMGQGRYVHPLRPRTLTPHEAARLQFLPDFVRFDEIDKRTALSRAIGNAAPPRLTITVVEALVKQRLV
jgi:DNA (cytosine-5)-methyltransferase 1